MNRDKDGFETPQPCEDFEQRAREAEGFSLTDEDDFGTKEDPERWNELVMWGIIRVMLILCSALIVGGIIWVVL